MSLRPKCDDCGRVFDLLDETDSAEWSAGHDCEPAEPCSICGATSTHFPVAYGDPGFCCTCFECDGEQTGEYEVRWAIRLEASSPEDALRQALAGLDDVCRRPTDGPNVFVVRALDGHDARTDLAITASDVLEVKTQEVSECLSCQFARVWKDTGSWPSPEAERHWSLWGCTCDPDIEADALAYMRSVTE